MMLLSIVVLSYNRPMQLRRILDKFLNVALGDFELVIKDDRSPCFSDIEALVFEYKNKLNINLRLHCNDVNMGYDRNLIDAFSISFSEYVFLLSDDDYVDGLKIENILDCLSNREHKIYFTPYSKDGIRNRCPSRDEGAINFGHVLYNSILFSGLVFHRESVARLPKNMRFLGDCIYSQVYLAGMLVFETGGFGFLPDDFLFLGGDGENYFGKNESAINRNVLEDRKHVAANLNYQGFLFKVVRQIASLTDRRLENDFVREYKKRLVSYGLRTRSMGLSSHFVFVNSYLKSDIPIYYFPFAMVMAFFLVPSFVAKKIYLFGVRSWRRSG